MGSMNQKCRNYHDNSVFLKVDKKIEEIDFEELFSQHSSDNDVIILMNYYSSDHILELIYRCNKSKWKIMENKIIHFKNYEFQIEKCYRESEGGFVVSQNSIILQNFSSNENLVSIEFYAKSLVPSNEINRIEMSCIFADTYYFHFEKPINFNELLKRHRITPRLHEKEIKIYQSLETFMVLIELNVNGRDQKEIHKFLNSIFQRKNESYWQCFDEIFKNPFIIVKFLKLDFKLSVLANANALIKSDFIKNVEDIANIYLLNDFLSLFESRQNGNTNQKINNSINIKQNYSNEEVYPSQL